MANLQMAQSEQQRLQLPPGFKLATPFPFGSLNQLDSRPGIPDNEFFWIENLIKDGNGQLRSLYDVGAAVYTASSPRTVVSFFFYNIGTTQYCAAFLDNGTADQVDLSTGAVTHITTTPNTFYRSSSGQLPACCQSGSQYLLIANNNSANDYWIWDGSVLYSAGSVGPVVTILGGGSNYSSNPTVTAYGGSGSGVTATPILVGSSVAALIITGPGSGYAPTDIVAFQFSGGGSDTGAILTASIGGGVLGSLTIVNAGSGGTPGTYPLTFTGGGGSSAAGTYTVGSLGTITGVVLSNGGSGYTSSPTVGFGGVSGITGASVVASLKPGSITSVTVTNGGTGYTATPTLTVVGGGGTGAILTATISAGAITGVSVVNGGSGYITAPTIIVNAGANNAAVAEASMMPTGISGTTIETYNNRVIVAAPFQATGGTPTGGIFNMSAAQSLVDFSTSAGGVEFTSNDRFLRSKYVVMRQSNGYLYPLGDSSASVISNIQTSGNPLTTTFNYQNVDPQVGIAWRDTCQDFGRTSLFANALGIYGLYGGAVTKVSSKIDHLFADAPSGGLTPSSAVANIRAIKCYLMLMTVKDPRTDTNRNIMVAWDQTNWFVVSQSVALIYIGTQEVNSNLTAYGTDGSKIYPLLQTPSTSITKTLSTKFYGANELFATKQSLVYYVQATDKSTTSAGVTMSVNIETENGSYTPVNQPSFPNVPPPNGQSLTVFGANTDGVLGQYLGWTISSTSPDFEMQHTALGYHNVGALIG